MRVLHAFFKTKETYIGMMAALAFQLIFFSVWLTAYDGVENRTDQLDIALVNEDMEYGPLISDKIKAESPFPITDVESLDVAKQEMDVEKKWSMIIHLPEGFSKRVQDGETAELNYYINQSNPSISRQMMETAANAMTKEINEQIYSVIQDEISTTVPGMVAEKAAQPEMAEQLAEMIVMEMQERSTINPVQPSIIKTNNVEGFKASMVPLMVVLASFIGAMIMSQQLQFASELIKERYNRWSLFVARQVINIAVALSISIITLMNLFNIDIATSLFKAWLFQSILFFSFLAISQLFVILFGNLGMVFNIALTAVQLVSSGAMVPKELLASFYQSIGAVLPATYGVNGYFSMIYGGGDLVVDMKKLCVIVGISLLIVVVGLVIKQLVGRVRGNARENVRRAYQS